MRVILINRYFHPDQSATSRMLSSLAFGLAAAGMKVVALASRRFHDRPEAALPAREETGGVAIHRLAGTAFGRRRLAGRAADYMSFHAAAAGWLLARARRGDLCVVCTDPPLLSVSVAAPLALRGAHMVNWVMDLFPEAAIELGMLAQGSAAARLAVALRDWSARRALLNVCPTDSIARFLAGRPGASRAGARRERVLHHWSDGEEIFPVPRDANALRLEWNLADRFVVGYSGNFGRAHEFGTLLDAARLLAGDDRFRFLLVGDGQKRPSVEAEVARRRLANVVMKPLQPRERLAESLGAADVHLVSLLPGLEYCVVPSKFYGILAAGRPTLFIGDAAGEVARAAAAGDCGLSVAIGDAEGLARAIRALAEAPERHARLGANARRLFETAYTRERGVAAWRDLLQSAAPPAPALVPGRYRETTS